MEVVGVAELEVGDLILVRPGERIGADGVVVDGSSEVDQATITGEPLPVFKSIDSEIYAGTVNGTGSLTVRVGAAAHESVVARIVALVEDASARSQAGAEVVGCARDAFDRISLAVADVSDRIAAIAQATNDVASVAEQSSASVEQVSASTEETSASTQQIAASAQELARTAEELEHLVHQFRLQAIEA